MQTSRRLLFYGLCFFLSFSTVIAIRYLPTEAINFTKCDPALNQCPAHSYCEKTGEGYYCGCENDFYNDKEKLTITYPGGECLARCKKGQTFPCACDRGYVSKVNENGLYECTDKCKNDSDCPFEASCKSNNCYCNHICQPQQPNCVTLVKLDGVCTEPSTTRSPFLTSNVVDTAVYTQSGSPTSQPAPRSTTTPLLTSSMNMGNTTHYNQLTSTVEISVTSHSISKKKTEEPGATTSQPEILCRTCPPQWKPIGLFCYYFSTDTLSWDNAKDECVRKGSALAFLKNKDEADALKPSIENGRYWIGLRRDTESGKWKWVDGSMMSHSTWKKGEPNNLPNEDCAESVSGYWNDLTCERKLQYICKKCRCC